jgi:putative aldouronate transport system substrate-binding protein
MRGLTRRTFLRASSLVVTVSLASACAASVPATSPTAVAPSATAAARGSTPIRMPTYQPITIAPPDLPGDDKVEPGYFAFPSKLDKTVTETPIKGGGEVNVMTWNVTGPIAQLETNTAWQAINRQVGAKINLVNNVSNSDYRTKLTAVVAGGELPDTVYIPATPGGQSAPFPQFPDFLEQSGADLAPYLSGDAVKELPNLAAIPTQAWKSVTHHNKIFGVRVSFPLIPGTVLCVHQEMLDAAAVGVPHSTDEFKSILQRLQNVDAGVYGIGASVQGADTRSGAFDLGMYQMYFGAPNNWRLDTSGKLTRSFETDQYKAAVAYARDLIAAGLYHPDSPTYNQVSVRTNFVARKYAFVNSGWLAAAIQYWGGAQAQTPPGTLGIVTPFGSAGAKGSFYTGTQLFGWSLIKKASVARVKDLLRFFNFLAAAFDSETHAARGSIVNQGFLSAMGDIIAGRRPFADYDGLLRECQASGGNQIRTEFERAVAAG